MKEKFFYQPDFPTSVICWSHTFIILLFGFILWLEITVFQIWTLIALTLFLITAGLQCLLRRVELSQDGLLFHTVIPQNAKRLKFNDIKSVSIKKSKLTIQTKYQKYSFFLRSKSAKKLYDSIMKLI
ncbi:hypothetical protein FC19_GL001533 [Liquorilactobacillus aquaticus DSM 21051]|uniref:Pore-forming protein n=1 Tax=Liquorilactobacillus aquaticus DSM 21051 TaxID=1423725 RepID=A0A0R2D698_9LACO|nr:EbsA family protein [Liquorilactobacillus aquaticus]KRM97492.1 hypothetical protein FC19_GL001533 [Liquorilactobacillus aquaticus DSM 21051]